MTHEAATTVKELPEALPSGERILWQGAPAWLSLYRRAFHSRTLMVYFAALLALRGANVVWGGGGAVEAMIAMLWLLPVAAFALGVLALVAWLNARASWYTITDHRVVMRIGIVLEITFNFPFKVIDGAGLRLHRDGTGDIPLTFMEGEQIAYAHLWPHVRPWRFRRTEPMLRCIPEAAMVADLLARSMATDSGGVALPIRASAPAGSSALDHAPVHVTASAAQ